MAESMLTLMLFVGVIAVAGMLFAGWVIVHLVAGVTRLVMGVLGVGGKRSRGDARPCPHLRCLGRNPPGARFCRRCGRALEEAPIPRHATVQTSSSWWTL